MNVPKPFYLSKTVLANFLAIALAALQQAGVLNLIPQAELALAVAFLNLCLRFVTKQPLSVN
jgi:hypothetical protein